jgi:ATP/maltotriose-dependent transcriptional regulator MalT
VPALVAEGRTAAAVARRLQIAERTVHEHLQHAYAKLGVSDRVSAVLRAHAAGVLPRGEGPADRAGGARPAQCAASSQLRP